ncbi:MAG: hypothetical protein JF626_01595 [Polaromonas sp.]|nr:hypothetical protein [Polaromonas sp.]
MANTRIPMSPKIKVIAWIFGIFAAYGVSVGIGVYRITSSEIFPLAKRGLEGYLVATQSSEANKPVYFKWWTSWYFRNQSSNGWAEMKLCTSRSACHNVIAYTDHERWQINVDGKLVNTAPWTVLTNGKLANPKQAPAK